MEMDWQRVAGSSGDRRVVFRSVLAAPASRVFAWHRSADALERLIPPWEPVRVVQRPASLGDGSLAVLLVGRWPARIRWVAVHGDYMDRGDSGGEFTDEQARGPFAMWRHRHVVREGPEAGTSILEDEITYRLPLAPVSNVVAGGFVRRKLERMFRFRHEATARAVSGTGGPGA